MLLNLVTYQREEMAEKIFGQTYDLRVDVDLVLNRNVEDSKGKGKGNLPTPPLFLFNIDYCTYI